MKGDFTRVTFRSRNHYRGVLQQQGRVQLDADWNEQVDIEAHIDEVTTADLVGGCGGPCDGAGFSITCDGAEIPADGCAGDGLTIGAGRYYVDGILCENEDPVLLGQQPDLPVVELSTAAGLYLAYLDVWREHLTALERPDLREVALGGPDTTTREKTVWQVKLQAVAEGEDGPPACSDFEGGWVPDGADSTGTLAAQSPVSDPIVDPCVIPPGAGFRRLENQLYRVEIHDGSRDADGKAQTPTYTWSRDNGTVVVRLENIVGNLVTLAQPGKDSVLGFAAGQWVEVSDEEHTLLDRPGVMAEITSAQGTELTVNWHGATPPVVDPNVVQTVRRWESAGALAVAAGTWIDLEDGVQVAFEDAGGAHAPAQTYRTGDYWVIPARTAILEGQVTNVGGSVEWPQDPVTHAPLFEPRQGIDHHYCPLAILRLGPGGGGEGATWTAVSDCRNLFPPLTGLTRLVYVGGDGQEAMPGDPLPQPLEVGVENGSCRVQGLWVRFQTPDGGTLSAGDVSASDIEVLVDDGGIASCSWTLDPDQGVPSQRTQATLLDDHGNQVGLPVDFSANLSIAGQVAIDPGNCKHFGDARTVQEALDLFCANDALYYVSGDGQEGSGGQELPFPLQARVANGRMPMPGMEVRFQVTQGGGTLTGDGQSGSDITVTSTDPDGVVSVVWQLDEETEDQRVEATLGGEGSPSLVAFNAQLTQQATRQPGVHVEQVFLPGLPGNLPTGQDLLNDSNVQVGALEGGIVVVLDDDVDAAALVDKPTCFVTVEVPFPLVAPAPQPVATQPPLLGFQPIVLQAVVGQFKNERRTIFWQIDDTALKLLEELVVQAQHRGLKRVLAHFTLKGNFIWSLKDPSVFLDGDSFGRPADGRTDLLRDPDGMLSGDGLRGGDFEMWFWLV